MGTRGVALVSLSAIETYVQSCFARGIALRTSGLAQALGVSRGSLNKAFRGLIGTTPASFLRMTRLKRAKQLLAKNIPTRLVAHRAGYGTERTFARSFFAATGSPPSAYRFERNVR